MDGSNTLTVRLSSGFEILAGKGGIDAVQVTGMGAAGAGRCMVIDDDDRAAGLQHPQYGRKQGFGGYGPAVVHPVGIVIGHADPDHVHLVGEQGQHFHFRIHALHIGQAATGHPLADGFTGKPDITRVVMQINLATAAHHGGQQFGVVATTAEQVHHHIPRLDPGKAHHLGRLAGSVPLAILGRPVGIGHRIVVDIGMGHGGQAQGKQQAAQQRRQGFHGKVSSER